MPIGFFFGSEMVSKAPVSTIPSCGACGLYKTCQSPKMAPVGAYKRRILLIGQSPGREEDKEGRQFVGASGRLLRDTLSKFDIDMKRDCLMTNALICHPINSKGKHDDFENKGDRIKKVEYCRANLINTIKQYKPTVIIPLGFEATYSLLSWLYKDDIGDTMNQWLGWQIPEQTQNTWICPTWHPSFILRSESEKRRFRVIKLMWEQHLKDAVKKTERPWKVVPNYKSQVEIVKDPEEAARAVRIIRKKGGMVTIDYETNRLKPDHPNRKILCCSVCWEGKRTIAFMWEGPVVAEMKLLFLDPRVGKAACNMKFEDRWTRAVLGIEMVNWKWCTMNNAHICDNRSKITSNKFQAFVRLGFGEYEDKVAPFISGKNKEVKLNRLLEEVSIDDLLLYCGLDSLTEYHIMIKEAKQLNLLENLKCPTLNKS